MEKYFGVFRICCKYGKEEEMRFKFGMVGRALENDLGYFDKAKGNPTQDKQELSRTYFAQKQWIKNEERLSRGGSFHYVLWKHQCDKDGNFVPTKKEADEYYLYKKAGAV